jgi:hypothetical protein
MNGKIKNENYILEFWDDFDHDKLDLTKWIPYYLPQWSNCNDAKAKYTIDNSVLTLRIEKNQKAWCPEFNGNVRVSSIQTGIFSGKLSSQEGQHHFTKDLFVREEQQPLKLYIPKFGYIEFKAKCNITKNHVVAFWMIGFEDKPQNSAEICIFELKGGNININLSKIGYGVHPFSDDSIIDEFYEDEFNINVFSWNFYGVEWLQDRICFYFNNELIRTIYQSPQYEMQFMINIYDIENNNAFDASFDIDYVASYSIKPSQI